MSILIKNVILDGKKTDIFIGGNKIERISRNLNLKADEKIDGKGEKAILPGLINCHTHSAMTLFRGYGDDLPLKEWLEKKIWPLEAKLTDEDVYWGTKLAILEMIKTGTTCFNDMYWCGEAIIEAVKEMSLRAVIGPLVIDFSKKGSKENFERIHRNFKSEKLNLIKLAVAPHSLYAVSRENLIWAKNFVKKDNLLLHIHISETEKEVKDCLKKYRMRPVEYLERIGFLSKNCILAHSIWLSEKEIKILAKRKPNVVYNPCSNLKLATGEIFPYKKLKEKNINVCLGTDGAASNNNLDLFEEMKFGSLLQKHKEKDPTIAKAKEVLNWATINGAKALKINSGKIEERKLADIILIDLNKVSFVPGYNLISDLVYSASGDCVSDVICNGKILMRDKEIEGEKKIVREIRKRTKKLINN
jgi:5-methylthioadenosine/S-adenosylhomocysteine deaminase